MFSGFRRHFKALRVLLLQVPIIQGLIYIVVLGLRAEDVVSDLKIEQSCVGLVTRQ